MGQTGHFIALHANALLPSAGFGNWKALLHAHCSKGQSPLSMPEWCLEDRMAGKHAWLAASLQSASTEVLIEIISRPAGCKGGVAKELTCREGL